LSLLRQSIHARSRQPGGDTLQGQLQASQEARDRDQEQGALLESTHRELHSELEAALQASAAECATARADLDAGKAQAAAAAQEAAETIATLQRELAAAKQRVVATLEEVVQERAKAGDMAVLRGQAEAVGAETARELEALQEALRMATASGEQAATEQAQYVTCVRTNRRAVHSHCCRCCCDDYCCCCHCWYRRHRC